MTTVVVRDPSTFGPKVFGPGDDVPEWAADLITNPMVWSSGDDSEDPPGGDDATVPAPPPVTGRGSGIEAWKRYATANGVELENDMSRDDVIAACELAEVPIN